MAKITADLVKPVTAPIHGILDLYDNKLDFIQDLESYLQAGVVISTPSFFLMGKPVNKSLDPCGQWYTDTANCDAWYVKWASGKGALQYMMETVKPLAHVMFSRLKGDETTDYKIYNWNKFKRRIDYGSKKTRTCTT